MTLRQMYPLAADGQDKRYEEGGAGKNRPGSGSWSGQLSRTSLCRPHSPCSAAATRTGRPLATVLPLGLSFYKITEELLKNAAERLNKRPRNCLTDQTRAEVLNLARTACTCKLHAPDGQHLTPCQNSATIAQLVIIWTVHHSSEASVAQLERATAF